MILLNKWVAIIVKIIKVIVGFINNSSTIDNKYSNKKLRDRKMIKS